MHAASCRQLRPGGADEALQRPETGSENGGASARPRPKHWLDEATADVLCRRCLGMGWHRQETGRQDGEGATDGGKASVIPDETWFRQRLDARACQ